jgi:predicted AlkP superfamily phosphohydrolase/phosphomutase
VNEYTYPASVKQEISRLVGDYPVDVEGFRTYNKEWLRDQIYEMTRKHFEVIRYLLATVDWDYFQFVEIGVDRVHHGFLEIPRSATPAIRAGESCTSR